jgi:hypothetical protein
MKRTSKKKQVPVYAVTSFKSATHEFSDETKTTIDGLYLKHFWQNADDPKEVIFLLSTNDLNTAKQFIKKNGTQNRKETQMQS